MNPSLEAFDQLDQDVLAGKWQQLQGALRERWGKLTEDDLMQVAGKKDRLLGVLQERYGYSRQEANRLLNDFMRTYSEKKDALTMQETWFSQNKVWVGLAALTAAVTGIVAFYFTRSASVDTRS